MKATDIKTKKFINEYYKNHSVEVDKDGISTLTYPTLSYLISSHYDTDFDELSLKVLLSSMMVVYQTGKSDMFNSMLKKQNNG